MSGGRQPVNPGLPQPVWRAVTAPSRLSVVASLQALGSGSDPDFDRLTTLAATLFSAPVALVTLVDAERQQFRSCLGVELADTPIGVSFCAHAIAGGDVMIVPDATADRRFSENPLVTGAMGIRFYVGAPIYVANERIGTLCVLDRVARPHPERSQVDQLKVMADLAASLFTLKEGTHTGILARRALAHEEKRRALALAAASLASWVWNVGADTVECDEMLPPLFGLPPSQRIRPRQFFHSIDPRDARETETRFRSALSGSEDYSGEYRVRGFDPPRWLATRGRVIERGVDGQASLVFGVSFDITERKAADERQRLLLRELNHRVKNTLATVQALASQTVRHASEPGKFLEAFSARLQALGAAHGLLSDNEWRGIGLSELVRVEMAPFDLSAHPRIRVSGREIHLNPDQALGLSLVLHELASNAAKYGSLSVPAGTVDLSWRIEGAPDRKLHLSWKESGGPAVKPPERIGFGSILIRRSLAKVIASEVRHEFHGTGVTADIVIPLEGPP